MREKWFSEVKTDKIHEVSICGDSELYPSDKKVHVKFIVGKTSVFDSSTQYSNEEVQLNVIIDDRLDSVSYISTDQAYTIGAFLINWSLDRKEEEREREES